MSHRLLLRYVLDFVWISSRSVILTKSVFSSNVAATNNVELRQSES